EAERVLRRLPVDAPAVTAVVAAHDPRRAVLQCLGQPVHVGAGGLVDVVVGRDDLVFHGGAPSRGQLAVGSFGHFRTPRSVPPAIFARSSWVTWSVSAMKSTASR